MAQRDRKKVKRAKNAQLVKYAWMENASKTAVLVPRRFVRRVREINVLTSKVAIPRTVVHAGIRAKVANRSTRRSMDVRRGNVSINVRPGLSM